MASNDGNSAPPLDPRIDMALLRSSALNNYSKLEQSLCMLLQALLDTGPGEASLVFYNIKNTRSRDAILEKLLKKNADAKFKPFWRSALKEAGKLASTRNNIIHWSIVTTVEAKEHVLGVDQPTDVVLEPPNVYWRDENTPSVTRPDLAAFCEHTDALARTINMFSLVALAGDQNIPQGVRDTWQEIYLIPFAYPFPDNHPLHPSRIAQQDPPRSS